MADAALAIARRLLAGPGGAAAAADALRAAADADEIVASDARLWAALAYLCTEAGDTSGAAHARHCITRLRAPEEQSPVRSLATVLEDEVATPRRRGRQDEKNAEQYVADRIARRVAQSAARMAELRETARELFSNVSQLQPPLRGEHRPDGVSRLVRRMGVLRARGRNIVTAVREDLEAGEKQSQRFAEAAVLSSDDEENSEEDDAWEDEGSEDDDNSETDCDSTSNGSDHPFSPSNMDESELDEEFDDNDSDFLDSSHGGNEMNNFTSDGSTACYQRMRRTLHWSSSSSSLFADDDTVSHCCCESSTSSTKSYGRSTTQTGCDDFFGAPLTFTEPICCAVYRLNASDSDDDSTDFSAHDTRPRHVSTPSFWNSPASHPRSASGRGENLRSAATAAWISSAQIGSSRDVYACSPITPHVPSDTDRPAVGSASSRRPLELTASGGRSFFYDIPNGHHGPQQRNSSSLDNATPIAPVYDSSGRGISRSTQLGAAQLAPARPAGQASTAATGAAAGSGSEIVPRARRWSRSRLRRITAPNPESSSSSDSDSSLDVALRTRRRVQTESPENVTPGYTSGALDTIPTEHELSRQRTQRHIRTLERETAITRDMTRMLSEENQADESERNEDVRFELTRTRAFLGDERPYPTRSREIESQANNDEGNDSSDYEVDDDVDGDDVVLHQYYLSNALRALRGGGGGEDEEAVAWEAVGGEYNVSEGDFEDDDYDDFSEPGEAMDSLIREFEQEGRILGSDHEDMYSPENSTSNVFSAYGSVNGSTIADRGISDDNYPGNRELERTYRANVPNFRRRNLVLRAALNGLNADNEVNANVANSHPTARRSRGRLQHFAHDLDGHHPDLIDAESVERAGEYVSEDGDDSDDADWLTEHDEWLDVSHDGNGLSAAFWHDDEDELFFCGEKRTTAEMEAIAPGHVAPTELQSTICVICTEELGSRHVRKLPCGHYFHLSDCVDEWCRRSATCPTCRAVVTCPTSGTSRRSSIDRERRSLFDSARRMRFRQRHGPRSHGGYASA